MTDRNLGLDIDLTGFNFLDGTLCSFDDDRMMLEDLGNPDLASSGQNFAGAKEYFLRVLENFVKSNGLANGTVGELISKKCEER